MIRKGILLFRPQIVAAFLLFTSIWCGIQAPAQAGGHGSPARILQAIDERSLVRLAGNTHPAANPRNDLGRVSPGLPMSDLVLVLSRSAEQQAAFDNFEASQYDASSQNFHHWLEPAEVGERFGPSKTDIAIIGKWLSGHGFSVDEVSKDCRVISSGTEVARSLTVPRRHRQLRESMRDIGRVNLRGAHAESRKARRR